MITVACAIVLAIILGSGADAIRTAIREHKEHMTFNANEIVNAIDRLTLSVRNGPIIESPRPGPRRP